MPARGHCREALLQLVEGVPRGNGWRAIRRVPRRAARSRIFGCQAQELKEVGAEQALELRLLKKSMIADRGDEE